MQVQFHPAALAELDADAEFYQGRASGLGHTFIDAVEAAAAFLGVHPHAGRPLSGSAAGLRRWSVRRYPYGLIYVVQDQRVLVLAVAHAKRDPVYWLARVPE